MEQGLGVNEALDAVLDDALKELEEDAVPRTTVTPASASSPTAFCEGSTVPSSRRLPTPSTLAFDPLKRPSSAAPQRWSGFTETSNQKASGRLRAMQELREGLTQLTEELATFADISGGAGETPPWSQGTGINDTVSALQAAVAQTTHEGDGSTAGRSSEDDPGMQAIVDLVMQKLLSKEMLYEPMKEICSKYPGWFEHHEATLQASDAERYRRQYDYIQQIIEMYERDPDNSAELMRLMQEVQSCGQPPQEIVDDVAPGFDLSETLPQDGATPATLGSTPELPEECKIQ